MDLQGDVAKSRDGIGLIKENVASDDGVELRVGVVREQIGALEVDGYRSFEGSLTSLLDQRAVAIDAGNAAGRADDLGCEEGNIAHSAAKVEDTHARGESGGEQILPGPATDDAGLKLKPFVLAW